MTNANSLNLKAILFGLLKFHRTHLANYEALRHRLDVLEGALASLDPAFAPRLAIYRTTLTRWREEVTLPPDQTLAEIDQLLEWLERGKHPTH